MAGKSRAPISPATVKEALPELEPEVVGGGPIRITDGLASSIRNEVAPAMSNAVAQDLMRDAREEAPEEGALGELAAEQGSGQAAGAPPAAPAAASPGAPPEVEPDQEQAARDIADASGGQALPGDVREEAEQALGADLSDVKIHVNEPSVETIDAGAAAIGKNVFFAPGAFDATSDEGKALLFHELAHTKDASPTNPGGDLTLGGTDTGAEAEADAVYDAVKEGEPVPEVGDAGSDGNTIRRGEAGVHQNDITMPGMGVNPAHMGNPENPNGHGNDFRLGGYRHRDSANLSGDQRAALQVYAGNFMSDFSQANVPKALDMLSNVPTMRNGQVTTIGAQGAGIMLQSLVRAFAILELGTEAAALVTAQTTEMYEAERHIDNPMGTSASDYVVANEHGTAIATAETPPELLANPATAIRTTDPTPEQLQQAGVNRPSGSFHEGNGRLVNSLAQPRHAAPTQAAVQDATAQTHAGSAVPGMQFDNPALFQVSDAGLANHIYNSVEASKQSYLRAAQAGPTPIGRMHVGYADHIVQDYFSHSNFIEVALNKYIGDALATRRSGGEADHDHDEHDHGHGHEAHGDEHGPGHADDHDHDHGHDHGHGDEHGSGRPHTRDEFFDRMQAMGPMARTQGQNDLVSPQFVATMYNATSEGGVEGANGQEEGPRDAITTGSFGASDTMISLAHIFVPMIPKLHESLERSVESLLGVVESAPPGADWPLITDMLTSSGRDGAVLHTMLQGLSDAGVAVSVPSGVGFEWSEVAVSPGWFGDPWTVNVPSGIALEYSDLPLSMAVGTFCGVAAKVNELKGDLQRYARYIGLDSVARAIDRAWTAAKDKFKQALKSALQKVILTILQKVTEELRGTAMTPQEAAQFASGGIENALNLANEAMHGAEERTSIAYRLNQGDLQQGSQARTAIGSGDMDGDGQTSRLEGFQRDRRRAAADTDGDGLLSAGEESAWVDAQKAELERRVGPVRGSGTQEDPWVPLAPLPPSHSEIGKDHPPHAPGHHEHEHHEHDHNPEMLNPGSAPVRIFPDDPKPHEHEHEEEHDDGGPGGHDHEHGSSFFGLGIALAVEAQRHMYKQMETVWQQTTGDASRRFADLTDGSGRVQQSGAAASEERDRGMQVSHDQTLAEARDQSRRERERNQRRGFRRTDDGAGAQAMIGRAPAFQDMMGLVDLYMSHPNDSNWWRTVVDSYVGAHPDEVYEHILRRNRMAMSQNRRL